MRARVKELHILFDVETHYQELVLPAEMDFPVAIHNWQSFGSTATTLRGPTMTFLEEGRAIFDSLAVLLSRPKSFPNLRVLDIHNDPTGEVQFELFNNELLLALPYALPKLEHLCLSNCFFTSCSGCVNSPLGHRPCAMTDISVHKLVEFATSLKKPLRSLSLGGAPWMTDYHVDALLSVVGKDLRVLELINCGLRHYSPDPSSLWEVDHVFQPHNEQANTPISTRSLEAVAEHCDHLRILRVLHKDFMYTLEETCDWDVALEPVLRVNPMLYANDGIGYRYLAMNSLRIAIQNHNDAFEPTEGSKCAKLSPFAACLSSSIFSCRNDPARVTRVLEMAVEVADWADTLALDREDIQRAAVAALYAALTEFVLVHDEANS